MAACGATMIPLLSLGIPWKDVITRNVRCIHDSIDNARASLFKQKTLIIVYALFIGMLI